MLSLKIAICVQFRSQNGFQVPRKLVCIRLVKLSAKYSNFSLKVDIASKVKVSTTNLLFTNLDCFAQSPVAWQAGNVEKMANHLRLKKEMESTSKS